MSQNDTHTTDDHFSLYTPSASNVRPVLMIFDQNKLHEWYMIAQKETVVGREPGTHIELNDDTISRRHASIIFENIDRPNEPPHCILVDNSSRNGTYLNGKRVSRSMELRNGDRVFIGNTCLAYFVRTELEIYSDQRLRSLATTDSLTGLMNRGYMAIQFQREFDRSKRYMRPLSLIMLDLDDFKKVNDTYGHKVGDTILEQTARIIEAKTRVHDISARYGGEEFSILLPETNLQGAIVIAERLRKTIHSHNFDVKASSLHVTGSIGLAELDLIGQTSLERLLEEADTALLRAKREGKDRVCIFDPEVDTVTS